MEDIKQSISISIYLPSVKIYLDDIEKIISILNEANPSEIKLESETKRFNFNEISDLKQDKLNSLEIKALFSNHSDFSVSLNNHYCGKIHLYCWDNSIKNHGIAKKLKDLFVTKKRVLLNMIFNDKLFIASGIVIPTSISLILKLNPKLYREFIVVLLFVIGICFLIFLLNLPPVLNLIHKNIIFLKYKKDSPNFIKRNKDQIIIGIILSIVGFALGILSTKLF